MSTIFFRAQDGHYSFAEMCAHISADGGDGCKEYGGICATSAVDELLNNTVVQFLGADAEVVIFTGIVLVEIYDGVRVEPSKEITRMSLADFREHADDIDYNVSTFGSDIAAGRRGILD